MSKRPRIGSLFSGYGGLEMGVQAALGGEAVWHSEIEPNANKILAHHWPDVPNIGNIAKIDWASIEPVDILTGGFPCQDVSHAGLRRGIRPDTRSGLWEHFALAIDQLRPSLVVIENVGGLLSANAHCDLERNCWCMGNDDKSPLRALGAVLGDLAELGFDAEWGSLRAADVGAPHGRLRVFILARPADTDIAGLEGWGVPTERRGELPVGPGGMAVGAGVALLPTPDASHDRGILRTREDDYRPHSALTASVARLLPTPTAGDGKSAGSRNLEGSAAHAGVSLTDAVVYGGSTTPRLLPTPAVNDMGHGKTVEEWDEWTAKMKQSHKNGNGHGPSLAIEAQRLLPTPVTSYSQRDAESWRDGRPAGNGGRREAIGDLRIVAEEVLPETTFGPYGDAVARWERILGRPAPAPTEPNAKGAARLSPKFVEFMMGLPAGHVTETPGLTLPTQLKALGNGCVPQQVEAAVRLLLARL